MKVMHWVLLVSICNFFPKQLLLLINIAKLSLIDRVHNKCIPFDTAQLVYILSSDTDYAMVGLADLLGKTINHLDFLPKCY